MVFGEILVVEMACFGMQEVAGIAKRASRTVLLVSLARWAVCGGRCAFVFLCGGCWWGWCVWVAGVLIYKYIS